MTFSDEKTVCCWCCNGGHISLNVEMPKTAFVIGETINYKVSITNLSNTNIEKLKGKLTKTVKYSVDSPSYESKDDYDEIVSFTEHGVGAHGEHTYDLQLAIPEHLEVPNFTNCQFFQASYSLKFTAVMGGCTMDLDIEISPELGHIQCYENNHENNYPPTTPGFVPATEGNYPPTVPGLNPMYPASPYPPPTATFPATPGNYPPPAEGTYPPTPAVYPPITGAYPPLPGGYPPSSGSGSYPSPSGGVFPPNYGDKAMYPGGPPSAPFGVHPSAPEKSVEAAGGPSAPSNSVPELRKYEEF